MPEHIKRLILLLTVATVSGFAAKEFFTAESFGVYGHYRADAVPDIAGQAPVFQGQQSCRQCHGERHRAWSQGKHQSVSCENCHGAAGNHPLSGKLPIPKNTVRLCAACHEAMPARPARQPQVVIREHTGEQECANCHNPHSPLHFKWEDASGVIDRLRSPGEVSG
jgi:hypothetical protein